MWYVEQTSVVSGADLFIVMCVEKLVKSLSVGEYFLTFIDVEVNSIQLKYCSTDEMLADLFTKCLNFDKYAKFRLMIGV